MRILAKAAAGLESPVVVREQIQVRAQVLILVLTLVQMMALIGALTGPRIRVRLVVVVSDAESVMIEQERAISPRTMIGVEAGY